MKKCILLLMILGLSVSTYSKQANARWYFLSQTQKSIHEDENIHVKYGIYTKYVVPDYGLAPYPVLRIMITNKSDKIVFIDLGTSYLKRNNIASVLYTPTIKSSSSGQNVGIGVNAGAIADAVGIGGIVGVALDGVNVGGSKGSSSSVSTYAQRIMSIPPKSSIFLDDIPLLTAEGQNAFGNWYYFKTVGIPKRIWCLTHKTKDIQSGETYQFSEYNTPFTIGCYLNYSFSEDIKDCKSIESTYYAERLIGTSFNTFTDTFSGTGKEFKIVDEEFPEWRDKIGMGELELIRLWAR